MDAERRKEIKQDVKNLIYDGELCDDDAVENALIDLTEKAAAEEILVHIEGELRTLERRYDRVPIEVLAFIEDIRDYFKKKFGVE